MHYAWDSILTHNHCLVCTLLNGFKYNNGCLVTSHLMQFMHLVQYDYVRVVSFVPETPLLLMLRSPGVAEVYEVAVSTGHLGLLC